MQPLWLKCYESPCGLYHFRAPPKNTHTAKTHPIHSPPLFLQGEGLPNAQRYVLTFYGIPLCSDGGFFLVVTGHRNPSILISVRSPHHHRDRLFPLLFSEILPDFHPWEASSPGKSQRGDGGRGMGSCLGVLTELSGVFPSKFLHGPPSEPQEGSQTFKNCTNFFNNSFFHEFMNILRKCLTNREKSTQRSQYKINGWHGMAALGLNSSK